MRSCDFVLQPVSKERLEKSVEVAVTVTLALVAIQSVGGVFVQKGRLGTNVTQVQTDISYDSLFPCEVTSAILVAQIFSFVLMNVVGYHK